ncbi:MAG: MASE1 domain-containing protein [Rhodocyclaceae bacterium]
MAKQVVLAIAYFSAGWLGLQIPSFESHIALVWLPTGIALAALFRWGWAVWPGVCLAAFLVNLSLDSSWLLAAGIAVGNTLGPLLAVGMLKRVGFQPALERQKDVVSLIAAAGVGMTVSASGGVGNLYAAGLVPLESTGFAWLGWWMGDTLGVLLIAPFLLTLGRESIEQLSRHRRGLWLWSLVAATVTWLAFAQDYGPTSRALPLAFLPLPLVAWAALHFGSLASASACLFFSALAALSTATGYGSFVLADANVRLFLLWSYMATIAVSGLLIAARQGERLRLERILYESEQHLRTLFYSAAVGQLIIEPDSLRILDCNQAGADVLGYSREELCRLRVADFEAASSNEEVQAQQQRLLTTGELQHETRVCRKDGELRDVHVTAVMLNTAEGLRFHITHVDITERKRAEREQQRLLRALRLLSECNMSLVKCEDEHALLADVCRLVVETGGYMLAWIGFAEHDAEKSIRPVAQFGYADGYLESLRFSWDEALEIGRGPTGTAIRTGTTQVNQNCLANPRMTPWRDACIKSGCQSSIALPLASQQQTLGTLNIYAAESDAFTVEELALLEELSRNVAFGIDALRARVQRAAAEAATQAKSAFLANLSHEIRTPLHVIMGIGHLLRRDLTDVSQKQRLDQLYATSDHLLSMINDVLDLSKIEARRFALECSDFRFDAVVSSVASMVEKGANEKGLPLIFDVAPQILGMTLKGDALRLTQVLVNLCGNAVKFTDQGEVRLRISCLAERADSVALRFTVEDTGIGIALPDQARLFQAFEQADHSSTRKYGGTGLGLAISQELVAMMGGRIRVDSQIGAGSSFGFEVVLLRTTAIVAETASARSVPLATDFHGRLVLLADDHPLGQEILFEMLEDIGCAVDVAADGIDAVECARARRYDLILMDLQMPRMDGLAATRAIRTLPAYRETPIIALTANAFAEDRLLCLDAGMSDHIAKPVTPATLCAVLGKWLPNLVVPDEQAPLCENELSLALLKIPGLDVGHVARRSPEHLADYCALLNRFVQFHGQDMERLREQLTNGEIDAAHVVAHQLKGVAGLIGARRIAALASEITQGLRAKADESVIKNLASECESELASLLEALRTLPGVLAETAST